MTTIAFIGAGNMASAIIGGLLRNGTPAQSITASDPSEEALKNLKTEHGICTTTDNAKACAHADIVVMAVKPQVLKMVAHGLMSSINDQALVISIAAGIGSENINDWLGGDMAVVRCMPNTPALVQQGAAGMFANDRVNDSQKKQAEDLLSAIGVVTWLESEDLIDAVTAVSGSGPAYFFLMLEAMISTGVDQGLTPEQSQLLAIQTAAGAARLAQNSDVAVDELRRRVTSPGGTTEQAILSFEQAGFKNIVKAAMNACEKRSREMASEFS
jgi:pyrroline-5-carboxylate reductase